MYYSGGNDSIAGSPESVLLDSCYMMLSYANHVGRKNEPEARFRRILEKRIERNRHGSEPQPRRVSAKT